MGLAWPERLRSPERNQHFPLNVLSRPGSVDVNRPLPSSHPCPLPRPPRTRGGGGPVRLGRPPSALLPPACRALTQRVPRTQPALSPCPRTPASAAPAPRPPLVQIAAVPCLVSPLPFHPKAYPPLLQCSMPGAPDSPRPTSAAAPHTAFPSALKPLPILPQAIPQLRDFL